MPDNAQKIMERLTHLESNYAHLKEALFEIKNEVRALREDVVQLSNVVSEKRGAVNMRRTVLYGVASFLSICAAFGLHEYIPWR